MRPRLKFRVQRDGKFKTIPFAAATYRDIEDARLLVARSRVGKSPEPDNAAVERAKVLAAGLAPLPKGVLRGERVEAHRDSDGQQRYTFRSISEDELEGFARNLLTNLPTPLAI